MFGAGNVLCSIPRPPIHKRSRFPDSTANAKNAMQSECQRVLSTLLPDPRPVRANSSNRHHVNPEHQRCVWDPTRLDNFVYGGVGGDVGVRYFGCAEAARYEARDIRAVYCCFERVPNHFGYGSHPENVAGIGN
ncbi:hypothetical protein AYI68_g7079 [Smittium mucronatum]|uniref:Uncharacterized protein n=1 Tax=Smittium mucronatum TaxID=133383 RepID=A0A1R0GMN6_9FUNG|nr:hypothetical protein AYI68_g7790 [Smittium mucronatum]OLY78863.1 hypothetical protein AYI68_g7079 [Smittium mucronatum]